MGRMSISKDKNTRDNISQTTVNLNKTPFANSKYHPPTQKVHLIERKVLNKFLKEIPGKKLVVLQAPAGYGKSTLLSQWYTRLSSENYAAGWLSLDDDDNNALILLSYLLRIISTIDETPVAWEITLDKAVQELSVPDLLVLLVHQVEKFDNEIILILDNFEILDNQVVTTVIKPVLQRTPDHFHLIIASRFQPGLELSRLRTQGLLHHIKATDLRFNRSEIEDFFQGTLSKHEEKIVAERTEGWPAAVQMAHFWHQRDGGGLLKKFSGVSEEIAEYLSEQVVLRLSEQVQECLFETSILDMLTEKYIKGIFSGRDYWSTLKNLTSLEPLLYPHGAGRGDIPDVYHMNPFFRDYLRIEFGKRRPEKKQAIHHSAALWFAADNQLSTSLRHANASHDGELAGRIVQDAGGLRIWISQGLSQLTTVHRLLDEMVIQCFPRLKLLRALILLKEGKLIKARNLYEEVRQESFDFSVDNKSHDVTALKLDALVVESTLLVNECKVATDDYLSGYETVVSNMAGNDELFHGNVMTLLCLSYHQQGAFVKGLDYANRAIAVYGKIGLVHGQIFNFLHKGVIQFAQGYPRRAVEYYKQALSIARKYYGTDKSKIIVASPLIAEVYYELNDLYSAGSHLHNVIKKLNATEGWFDIYAAGYITSAHMILNDAGLSAAIEFLDNVESEIEVCGLVGLMRIIQATRISFLSRYGLFDEANYMLEHSKLSLETYNTPKPTVTTWREREAVVKAIAELSIRRGDSQKIFENLLEISNNLLARRHIRSFIHIGTLTCLAGTGTGHTEQTWKLLMQVLDKSLDTGFVRFFIDQGIQAKKMLTLFEEECSGVISRHIEQHCHDIVDQFDILREEKQNISLTQRESELLMQLKSGKSDKVIARTLRVSPNTVRYHLKNIYKKLGVVNRTEAVNVARESSLIE